MTTESQKLNGYRQLGVSEVALINHIKATGLSLESLLIEVKTHLNTQSHWANEDEKLRIENAEPNRWLALAKTHFQEGLMALTRSVAQPSIF